MARLGNTSIDGSLKVSGDFNITGNMNINFARELYYQPGYLSEEYIEQYLQLGTDYLSGCSPLFVGYIGQPGTQDENYVVQLNDSSTTALIGALKVPKYKKVEPELSADHFRYRQYEAGTLDVEDISFSSPVSITIDIYSKNVSKIELGISDERSEIYDYIDITSAFNSAAQKTGEETINITTDYIPAIGSYYCKLVITYTNDESVTVYHNSSGDTPSFSVTRAGLACFTADTLVYTDKGYRTINEIHIGDKVLSQNNKNKQEYKEVDKLVSHIADDVYRIDIGNEIIKASFSHPFYVKDKGKVLAENLSVNDILVTKENKEITIKDIQIVNEMTPVYEIRVKDNNNYYVGINSILVYNEDSVL